MTRLRRSSSALLAPESLNNTLQTDLLSLITGYAAVACQSSLDYVGRSAINGPLAWTKDNDLCRQITGANFISVQEKVPPGSLWWAEGQISTIRDMIICNVACGNQLLEQTHVES